jgi:alpha-D-ribose 1-methylphosphonate 5-triphosphate synthase subunit PhnH
MKTTELPGIWSPATQQVCYRQLLQAMAYPGSIQDCADLLGDQEPLVAILACLVDASVELADPQGLLDASFWHLSAARSAAPDQAAWLPLDGRLPPPATWQPAIGSLLAPEHSATLVLRVERLGAGSTVLRLRGPGIDGDSQLLLDGLDPAWIEARNRWCSHPPMGVDILCCDQQRCCALPRSSRIEEAA